MYERILVPLDGSALAEGVLPHAMEVAKRFGSEVVLLQAVGTLAEILGQMAAGDGTPVVGPGTAGVAPIVTEAMTQRALAQHEGVVASARSYLTDQSSDLAKSGVRAQIEVLEGLPASVIMDYAQANGVGLSAMSTHGRGGLGRLVFGSLPMRSSAVPEYLCC